MSEREQFLRLIDSLLVVAGEWRALLGEAERLAGGPAS